MRVARVRVRPSADSEGQAVAGVVETGAEQGGGVGEGAAEARCQGGEAAVKFKQERIKTLIIQEVMKAITSGDVKDPRVPLILTITEITLSKDLHYCHLYFSMIGNDSEKSRAIAGLNSAAGFFQKIIGEKLKLRFTPKIEFRYDQKEEESRRVYDLLNKLEKQRLEKEKQ